MARDGILPKGFQYRYSEEKKEGARQPFIPLHGIGPDFKSVSAVTPDGKIFNAGVEDGPTFVESDNGKHRVADDLSRSLGD